METTAGDMWKLSVQLVGDEINKLPLCAHVVVSNDDLLTEILLRLPAISLLLFKSVSKRWLSLIKDTKFVKRRSQIPKIDPPSGLLIRSNPYSYQFDFVRLNTRMPLCRFQFKTIFKIGYEAWSNAFVVKSCNGLLLCYDWEHKKYYAYNPSINLFKLLPQPHILPSKIQCVMKMAFDPTKSPHYKVVYASSINDKNDDVIVSIQIQTYSSETGNWDIVCSDPFLIRSFAGFQSRIYWNDAIHWLTYGNGCLHSKLDLVNERPVLTNVELPGNLHDWDHKLFESRGCLLLLGMAKIHSLRLNVYNMRNGNSEWSFKYFINLCDIITPISRRWTCCSVLCIALGEREEDSYMVITFGKKTFQYNFVLKTSRDLSELNSNIHASFFSFTASFASV